MGSSHPLNPPEWSFRSSGAMRAASSNALSVVLISLAHPGQFRNDPHEANLAAQEFRQSMEWLVEWLRNWRTKVAGCPTSASHKGRSETGPRR